MYNYREAMKSDIMDYIRNEINLSDYTDREDLEENLNDELMYCDSVTGNGSGSYTFSRYEAMNNIMDDNMDLLEEACECFGSDYEDIGKHFIQSDFEYFDVTIRCYLLAECISDTLDEMEENNELNFDNEGNEEND